MKLQPMTDFVLEKSKHYVPTDSSVREEWLKSYYEIFYNEVTNYAKFLRQPLHLGMFVPVDEEGNVLKEELKYSFATEESNAGIRHKNYWEAKEKVLFNFDFVKPQDLIDQFSTIEDLANFYEPELTPSALKQIGL